MLKTILPIVLCVALLAGAGVFAHTENKNEPEPSGDVGEWALWLNVVPTVDEEETRSLETRIAPASSSSASFPSSGSFPGSASSSSSAPGSASSFSAPGSVSGSSAPGSASGSSAHSSASGSSAPGSDSSSFSGPPHIPPSNTPPSTPTPVPSPSPSTSTTSGGNTPGSSPSPIPSPSPGGGVSGGGGSTKCFPATASVLLASGERRRMSELHVGDEVLTYDPVTGSTEFSAVYAFLDRRPSPTFRYLRIGLSPQDGASAPIQLEISHRHRVFKQRRQQQAADGSATLVDVDARELQLNDRLVQCAFTSSECRHYTVVSIDEVSALGAYAPVTFTGTLLVDEVATSSYAAATHSQAHHAFAPLRMAHQLSALWWSDDETPQDGVHWYASMLYRLFGEYYYDEGDLLHI